MDDSKEILKAILKGQAAMKQELLNKIGKVEINVDKVGKRLDQAESTLIGRLDKIGGQLAYLEDDAPTKEEFDALEKRVKQTERKIATL